MNIFLKSCQEISKDASRDPAPGADLTKFDSVPNLSAPNDRQVKAIVDEVELRMRQAGASLVRREGEREGRWVLLDYLDVVIHVQHSEQRTYYALERIWKDCPTIPLPELVVNPGRTP